MTTQPLDREGALVLFRSTLALHGTPSSHAARMAVMFAALVECAKCHILTRADTACGACGACGVKP